MPTPASRAAIAVSGSCVWRGARLGAECTWKSTIPVITVRASSSASVSSSNRRRTLPTPVSRGKADMRATQRRSHEPGQVGRDRADGVEGYLVGDQIEHDLVVDELALATPDRDVIDAVERRELLLHEADRHVLALDADRLGPTLDEDQAPGGISPSEVAGVEPPVLGHRGDDLLALAVAGEQHAVVLGADDDLAVVEHGPVDVVAGVTAVARHALGDVRPIAHPPRPDVAQAAGLGRAVGGEAQRDAERLEELAVGEEDPRDLVPFGVRWRSSPA